MKVCTKCKEPKEVSEFNVRSASLDGLTTRCKGCLKIWQDANKSYLRHLKGDLKRYYGITVEFFYGLLKKQDEKCAICRTDKPGGRGRWHVDHNHDTNEIRGLLCHKCNVGLGHFNDDVNLLVKAVNYLGGTDGKKEESSNCDCTPR